MKSSYLQNRQSELRAAANRQDTRGGIGVLPPAFQLKGNNSVIQRGNGKGKEDADGGDKKKKSEEFRKKAARFVWEKFFKKPRLKWLGRLWEEGKGAILSEEVSRRDIEQMEIAMERESQAFEREKSRGRTMLADQTIWEDLKAKYGTNIARDVINIDDPVQFVQKLVRLDYNRELIVRFVRRDILAEHFPELLEEPVAMIPIGEGGQEMQQDNGMEEEVADSLLAEAPNPAALMQVVVEPAEAPPGVLEVEDDVGAFDPSLLNTDFIMHQTPAYGTGHRIFNPDFGGSQG